MKTPHQLPAGQRSKASSRLSRHQMSGYILFELAIAFVIFSVAALGLVKCLSQAADSARLVRRDQITRVGMRNFLEEIRRKPLTEMSTTYVDPTYGITYTSTTEPISLITTSGSTLTDLYNLSIKASSTYNGIPEETTLSVYVHKPAQQ
ncbi:MAG: hypothetical protein IPK32_10840 [Verrucomicrobiaceae bacterium]|nr:hypothetical protein [Verrucomicrobiaceae bacterium]